MRVVPRHPSIPFNVYDGSGALVAENNSGSFIEDLDAGDVRFLVALSSSNLWTVSYIGGELVNWPTGADPALVDRDGDGVTDQKDPFPEDKYEEVDSDGDGTGDNGDAFPNDPTEQMDTDKDGIGDEEEAGPGTTPQLFGHRALPLPSPVEQPNYPSYVPVSVDETDPFWFDTGNRYRTYFFQTETAGSLWIYSPSSTGYWRIHDQGGRLIGGAGHNNELWVEAGKTIFLLNWHPAELSVRYIGTLRDWPVPTTDRDGDKVANGADNCPDAANADQADLDDDKPATSATVTSTAMAPSTPTTRSRAIPPSRSTPTATAPATTPTTAAQPRTRARATSTATGQATPATATSTATASGTPATPSRATPPSAPTATATASATTPTTARESATPTRRMPTATVSARRATRSSCRTPRATAATAGGGPFGTAATGSEASRSASPT